MWCLRLVDVLYIVEGPSGSCEEVSGASAPPEPLTAPVAGDGFPKARASWSPFSVPSYFSSVARTSHCTGSYPAMLAIRAMSPGGHVFLPASQSYTCEGFACRAFASA